LRVEINPNPRDARNAGTAGRIDALQIDSRWRQDAANRSPMRLATPSDRCFLAFSTAADLVMSFTDACGEIDPAGGTLAISGAWVSIDSTSARILGAGALIRNGGAASAYVSNAACFQAIARHEVDHAMGLRDRPGLTPVLDRTCLITSANIAIQTSPAQIAAAPQLAGASEDEASAAATVQTTKISVAIDGGDR